MADAGPVRDCDRDLLEGRPRGDGMHKIDEAAIPLADVAEITSSDESLFKTDEWEAC